MENVDNCGRDRNNCDFGKTMENVDNFDKATENCDFEKTMGNVLRHFVIVAP